MKASYIDIRKRIKEDPKWWDENGVPRYDKFHPDLCPNIYANEVVLIKIQCQECGKHFLVERNWEKFSIRSIVSGKPNPSFSEMISKWLKSGRKYGCPIGYGDPPQHGGKLDDTSDCAAGSTMICYNIRIVEFWEKPDFGWRRKKKLEIELEEV